MTSSRPSPIWPYLLLMAVLFGLSIWVPSGWQSNKPARPVATSYRSQQTETLRPASSQVAVVSPAPASAVLPHEALRENFAADDNSLEAPHEDGLDAPSFGFTVPLAEVVAKRIADFRRFVNPQELLSKVAPPIDRAIDFPPTNYSSSPFPVSNDLLNSSSGGLSGFNLSTLTHKSERNLKISDSEIIALGSRPMPTKLLSQLNWLAQFDECHAWAVQVETLCAEYSRLPLDDSRRSNLILEQLRSLVDSANALAGNIAAPHVSAELRRARYAVERRLAIWEIANSVDRPTSVFANIETGDAQRQRLSQAIETADAYLKSIAYSEAWRNYLQIDDLVILSNPDLGITSIDARQLARRIVTRLTPRSATVAQRRVLQNGGLLPLVEALRPWASEPADYRELLTSVERYEDSGLASDASNVVAAQRRCKWSNNETDRQLASRIDEHYRNANVRMAFTADLLNRFMPEPQTVEREVRDRVLGKPVNGTSETTTELQVRLIPDPQRLHIWLEAQGAIDSQTHSSKGPVTVSDRGESNYIVHKAVVVDDRGMGIAPALAEAKSNAQLTGISTTFDHRPVISAVVRNRAEEQHDRQSGNAMREVEQKVASRASSQLDIEVNERLQRAEDGIRQQILLPLDTLGMAAEPIALETSAQRLTMRLRLAGANQLGGHTARPQAPSDSLASMQVHESALNNVLDQLQLDGKTVTLPELFSLLSERVGQDIPTPADLPAKVSITFAAHDAVRVRCLQGTIRVTLAIAAFNDGSQEWRDFDISATYVPEIEHLHARLVRQGPIELGGDAYKGQPEVKLRAIFAKVLPRDRKLDLVPSLVADNPHLADLILTQCVVDDGWIGIALGPDRTVARREMPSNSVMLSQ
jgi:hypothetical protein